MSFEVASSCIGPTFPNSIVPISIGIGLTVYGGYNYLTSSQKSADELATGVTAIAVGAGLINSEATTTQMSENPINCPIDWLNNFLSQSDKDSKTAKMFKFLEKTEKISCENFLPWRNEFDLGGTGNRGGIDATHLRKSVMWSIDPSNQPFVVTTPSKMWDFTSASWEEN